VAIATTAHKLSVSFFMLFSPVLVKSLRLSPHLSKTHLGVSLDVRDFAIGNLICKH
jgi:hypothetical protein